MIAGINAAMKLLGREQIVLDRSQGYIGVLIDDLVTKETHEPYRMMTSRAEYRLILRQDNADLRLTKIGYQVGLIDEVRYQKLLEKERLIAQEEQRLTHIMIGASAENQEFLRGIGSSELSSGTTLADLLKRPEITYQMLAPLDPDRKALPDDVIFEAEINIKYEGYIKRQLRQVEQFKKMEEKKIPGSLDYKEVPSLRIEARQKLIKIKPENVGQASRISGVSPADISVLLVYLEHYRNRKAEEE